MTQEEVDNAVRIINKLRTHKHSQRMEEEGRECRLSYTDEKEKAQRVKGLDEYTKDDLTHSLPQPVQHYFPSPKPHRKQNFSKCLLVALRGVGMY